VNHRTLGRTGLSVSEIGLGTEFLLGLPEDEAVGVIHEAIDRGINYVDMFWAQPEFRDVMGSAFRGRREEAFITAHLGAIVREGQYALSRDPQVCTDYFHDYLERMRTDFVDVLFVHNCNSAKDYETAAAPGGLIEVAQSFVEEGKARFVGFSCHNVVTALRVIESGAIDVLMFPVNLASYAVPGKHKLLPACAEHNVGLVAMKVYGGGSLLRDKSIVELQDFQMGRQEMPGAPSHYKLTAEITPVKCMAYVLDQRQVATTVPGCKSVEELNDALHYYDATGEEKDYEPILPAFSEFATGECVYCNHCLPCPSSIDIGQTISLLEQGRRELTDEIRASYSELETDASDCIACGQCSDRCPFGVDVIAKMKEAVELFA
jgi:predicted aldo/keto reductase-like oxidoreductase